MPSGIVCVGCLFLWGMFTSTYNCDAPNYGGVNEVSTGRDFMIPALL
jgi:hypothetical protein